MKKIQYTALAAAFGLLMAGQVAAEAPSAELKVAGTIEVPGCDVAIASEDGANSSEYHFGDIEPSKIQPGNTLAKLNPLTKTWTIHCTGRTHLTYQIEDHQQESSLSPSTATYFGLGKVNGEGKIGYYEVEMLNAKISSDGSDPVDARTFSVPKGNTTFTRASSIFLNRNNVMGWSESAANNLAAADTFIADFKVTPTLGGTGKDHMNGTITEDVGLDGSMTLTFAFGL